VGSKVSRARPATVPPETPLPAALEVTHRVRGGRTPRGRAHLVAATGPRFLRSAAAELAPRALRAVERQLRQLVRFGIVCPERLPAARADAAHSRALGAGEYMHVRARGRFPLHCPDDLGPRPLARLPKGVALYAGGWGSSSQARPAHLRSLHRADVRGMPVRVRVRKGLVRADRGGPGGRGGTRCLHVLSTVRGAGARRPIARPTLRLTVRLTAAVRRRIAGRHSRVGPCGTER
jgi:hypothetical protein